jgi:hypothetical protein
MGYWKWLATVERHSIGKNHASCANLTYTLTGDGQLAGAVCVAALLLGSLGGCWLGILTAIGRKEKDVR